jgi:RNA-directed DNA polymerase
MNTLLVDLFQAYYDARRNKRNKHTSLQFEIAYESHLMELYEDLAERKYMP